MGASFGSIFDKFSGSTMALRCVAWGNYISPFVPHSFTARAESPEAIIIAAPWPEHRKDLGWPGPTRPGKHTNNI